MTHAHTDAEHAPHKRATRKKVVHHKTHRELEISAFQRKLDGLLQWAIALNYPYGYARVNTQQIKALRKKIAKRQAQV